MSVCNEAGSHNDAVTQPSSQLYCYLLLFYTLHYKQHTRLFWGQFLSHLFVLDPTCFVRLNICEDPFFTRPIAFQRELHLFKASSFFTFLHLEGRRMGSVWLMTIYDYTCKNSLNYYEHTVVKTMKLVVSLAQRQIGPASFALWLAGHEFPFSLWSLAALSS